MYNALDEKITTLTLAEFCEKDEKTGICGSYFRYGSTGMISLGDGCFYFSQHFKSEEGDFWGTNVALYKFDKKEGFLPM